MGGKKPLRRPLWPPTRATASNYYPLGLDGAGGAAKPLLRAPKKPAPLHGRLPAFSGAVDAFERARKCFLEWRYFFSIILSEFLKNRVALQKTREELTAEIEESKKKIRQFENREKIIKQKLSVEERKARNHRLCKRGGFMESLVPELIAMPDEDAKAFLRLALTSEPAQEFLKKRAENGNAK